MFEGRYRGSLIQTGRYLLAASRYIALNPVRAGLVERPEEWPWSAHRALLRAESDGLTDPRALFATIANTPDRARREYVRFVADADPTPHYDPNAPIAGDASFISAYGPPTDPAPRSL